MNQPDSSAVRRASRRGFLRATSAVAVAGALSPPARVHAAGSDEIKIALIGCGGRGLSAAVQAIRNAAGARVKLVALADAFQERVDSAHRIIGTQLPDRVDVPPERRFVGLDAYQKATECDVDMVLLCGPPGFRPAQFEAAVAAGRHVFMEKPVATDAPGVRRIMAANELAKQKGLAVAVGHHLRHEVKHRDAIARIHDGAIGDLQYLRAYFNSTGVWVRARQPDDTEMQYQVRNWYYFTWLSGDHIVEQHVHDLDIGNWMAQAVPVEAQGSGGRQVRIGPEYGEIFDHHTVEFTYANGLKMFSYCRHIPRCWNSFSQHAHGTKGSVHIEGHGRAEIRIADQPPVRLERGPDGHQLEHDHLFAALLEGRPYNEGDYGASSTMTAILGRLASYSGQLIRWDDALNSQVDLCPESLEWDAETKVKPGPDGLYACAMPGITKVI
jgi:myo-inositol 2-dehydrogenase / D-chiro-inositol 1-dehydrogenase